MLGTMVLLPAVHYIVVHGLSTLYNAVPFCVLLRLATMPHHPLQKLQKHILPRFSLPPTEKAEGAGLCLTYFTVVNFAVGNLRRLQKKPWKSSQTTPEL